MDLKQKELDERFTRVGWFARAALEVLEKHVESFKAQHFAKHLRTDRRLIDEALKPTSLRKPYDADLDADRSDYLMRVAADKLRRDANAELRSRATKHAVVAFALFLVLAVVLVGAGWRHLGSIEQAYLKFRGIPPKDERSLIEKAKDKAKDKLNQFKHRKQEEQQR